MKTVYKIAGFLRRIYWFIFRPNTFGAKGLLIDNGKVLLVKTTYSRQFTIPGGGIKKGEKPEDTVKRELQEETGIEVLACHKIGEYENKTEFKNDQITLFYIDDFQLGEKMDSPEIDQFSFFSLDGLPKNVSPATKRRLNTLNSEKVEHGKW